RVLEHVVTGDGDAPFRRGKEARHHPHGGRLPGAVGSDEPDDLSAPDLERHALDGREGAVALCDGMNADHRPFRPPRSITVISPSGAPDTLRRCLPFPSFVWVSRWPRTPPSRSTSRRSWIASSRSSATGSCSHPTWRSRPRSGPGTCTR